MATKLPRAKGGSSGKRGAKARTSGPGIASLGSSLDREAYRDRLAGLVRSVRSAMYVVTVCCDALTNELSENRLEVAGVLRVYAGDKLYGALQEAAVLLALFDGKTDVDPEGDEIGRIIDPE